MLSAGQPPRGSCFCSHAFSFFGPQVGCSARRAQMRPPTSGEMACGVVFGTEARVASPPETDLLPKFGAL